MLDANSFLFILKLRTDAALEENIPLAVSINTEKARAELLVANVLVEVRKLFDRKISFFSGVEFNVDREKSLTGFCSNSKFQTADILL